MAVICVMLMLLIQLSLLAPIEGSCENCATCQQSTTCLLCNHGYYLSNGICTLCQANCSNCYNETACAQCLVGFWLDADTGSCHFCRAACKSCDSYEMCRICEDKYFLQNGECLTCPNKCSTCLSSTRCTSCYQGSWGFTNCSNSCPVGCKNNTCDITAFCVECTDGTWGSICQYLCLENCLNNRCSRSGACSDGCSSGFYGSSCEMSCPSNCKTNVCSKNGECTTGCKPGFYESQCNQACPLNTCPTNDCFQNNGSCVSTCPETCVSCSSFTSCTSCKQGHYGTMCENRCPDSNCKECTQDGDCLECKDRWWGIECDQRCSDTCKSCLRNGTCFSCIAGYYNGESCDLECSANCQTINGDLVCSKDSGQCNGCKRGFSGKHCTKECSNGCGKDDDGYRSCRQDDGGCEFGCEVGFYGRGCAEKIVNTPPVESPSNTPLIGAVVGGIGVVLIVAAAIVVYFMRKQNTGCFGNMKEGTEGHPVEVTAREAETGIEYADLHERSGSDGFYNQLGFNDTSSSPYLAIGYRSRDDRTYSELQTETSNDHVVTTPAEYENMAGPTDVVKQYENVTEGRGHGNGRLNGVQYENLVL